MLSNMATSLILHKKIKTTTAKAKALRTYVEPLITKSKDDSTHSRRVVFSYLQNKDAVSELFREISPKIIDRPGGYTRILKLGNRLGDNADMCVIELVDYNENLLTAKEEAQTKSGRRRRRGGKKKGEGEPIVQEAVKQDITAEVEEKTTENVQAAAEVDEKEEVSAETVEPSLEVKEEQPEEKTEAKEDDTVSKVETAENVQTSAEVTEEEVSAETVEPSVEVKEEQSEEKTEAKGTDIASQEETDKPKAEQAETSEEIEAKADEKKEDLKAEAKDEEPKAEEDKKDSEEENGTDDDKKE